MAEVGEPTQYGYAERLMRTIKEEEVDLSEYRDSHDVYQHIGQFIEDVYMHKRVHSALGYLTPAEFEQQWLALPVNERATLCCPVLCGQYKQQKEQTPMRKLMVLSFITLDGVMHAPYLDEFLGKVLDEQWREPFDLLLGRKTFEIFASYWPYCDLPNVLAASDTIWF